MQPNNKYLGEFKVYENNSPKDFKLNFICKEYCGTEIYKRRDILGTNTLQELLEDIESRKHELTKSLINKDDIKNGDKVLVFTLFDFRELDVKEFNGSYLSDNSFLYSLSFAEDDRKCWVCSGLCNLAALAEVDFEA